MELFDCWALYIVAAKRPCTQQPTSTHPLPKPLGPTALKGTKKSRKARFKDNQARGTGPHTTHKQQSIFDFLVKEKRSPDIDLPENAEQLHPTGQERAKPDECAPGAAHDSQSAQPPAPSPEGERTNNFVTWNVMGLTTACDDLLEIFRTEVPDVLVLTETKLIT